jgi:phosphoribosylamine---glycine ligase
MTGIDVLVIGSGAREHALAWRLARDEGVRRVRIAPGNGGTPAVAETVDDLDVLDPDAVARHAARERYGLVVIGPEAPLAAGVADALALAGVPAFGPTRDAARLESSKAYAKAQMQRAGVPTAPSASFTDVEAALEYARRAAGDGGRLVVKADWLAAGKGVVVPETAEATGEAIRELFAGAADGVRLVLEERLTGREVSVFALVSGQVVVPLGAACDYKRLGDDDTGPNTGGMGAYAPVPWFGTREIESTLERVFEPVAWRMTRDETPYRGVLYAGLMVTADGPTVLEFNARFGDPEAQVLLPLLDGELAAALLGTARGERGLIEGSVSLADGAAVGVVVAAPGYPDAPETGLPVTGVDPAGPADDGSLLCVHAATRRGPDGAYQTAGGRVVTFVGRGPSLADAREAAYAGVDASDLERAQVRSDIAARELEALHVGDRAQLGDEAR